MNIQNSTMNRKSLITWSRISRNDNYYRSTYLENTIMNVFSSS